MPRISQLDPLAQLSKLDLFEVTQKSTNKSCSISAQTMANFFKTMQNGGFRGSTNRPFDDFTVADVGVWHWYGNDSITEMDEGILEIVSYAGSDDDDTDAKFSMKLSWGDRVYQRGYNGGKKFSNWVELGNKNGCTIEYGISDATEIKFPAKMFSSTPAIVCVPVNGQVGSNVCSINVHNASAEGFKVQKMTSSLSEVVEKTTETVTESGGTTTKVTTTEISRGQWIQDDGMTFFYIALSDAK